MSNMSYCRFRNTLGDLRDCADNLRGKLSEDEARARQRLITLCADILEDVGYGVEEPEDIAQLIADLNDGED